MPPKTSNESWVVTQDDYVIATFTSSASTSQTYIISYYVGPKRVPKVTADDFYKALMESEA